MKLLMAAVALAAVWSGNVRAADEPTYAVTVQLTDV